MSIENVQSDTAIAISVITGFLGSGKTTLLNYLLQHPDIDETAVLINEFGEIGLDHLLVEELDDEVLLLSSGCICCTVHNHFFLLSKLLPSGDHLLLESHQLH